MLDDDEGVDCGFEDVRGGWREEGFEEVFAGLSAVPCGTETESEAFQISDVGQWMNKEVSERWKQTIVRNPTINLACHYHLRI